jgi:hypothetical protein
MADQDIIIEAANILSKASDIDYDKQQAAFRLSQSLSLVHIGTELTLIRRALEKLVNK